MNNVYLLLEISEDIGAGSSPNVSISAFRDSQKRKEHEDYLISHLEERGFRKDGLTWSKEGDDYCYWFENRDNYVL